MMQQQMYHPGLLSAMAQLEPIPSGNLPPGFDASACRSVYVGNIHTKVTDALLAELFSSVGPLEGCKLIRKEKSSYGFVDYFDHRSAAAALVTLNGRLLFGQPIKVNWAYASGQREDTTGDSRGLSGHFNIFVGDLSPEVTDATLYAAFSIYSSCSDARVMWDQRSGRSRGFGFVSFRNQAEAEVAISEMNARWLGSRPIRCNWATKNSVTQQGEENGKQLGTNQEATESAPEAQEGEQELQHQHQLQPMPPGDNSQSNLQYTTVYVGNLAHEVSQAELHRNFYALGVGTIEDVRVQKDKGFGFVRYRTHDEAATAIQMANGRVICGKSVKCSWGSKPTLPNNSMALPPPMHHSYQQAIPGYSAQDPYSRQISPISRALLPLPQQTPMGMDQNGVVALPPGVMASSRSAYEAYQQNSVNGGRIVPHQMYY